MFFPVLCVGLTGCAAGIGSVVETTTIAQPAAIPVAVVQNVEAPIVLAAAIPAEAANLPVEMSIADAQIVPAVNLHRFKSKLPPGEDLHAGADLNGDGVAEALVLMTTPECLAGAGCSLVVFELTNVGFRPFSITAGVLPPVAAAAGQSMGWRHLVVAGADGRLHGLVMASAGYPRDIGLAPVVAAEHGVEVLLGKGDPSLARSASTGGWSMHVAADVLQPSTRAKSTPTSTAQLPAP